MAGPNVGSGSNHQLGKPGKNRGESVQSQSHTPGLALGWLVSKMAWGALLTFKGRNSGPVRPPPGDSSPSIRTTNDNTLS